MKRRMLFGAGAFCFATALLIGGFLLWFFNQRDVVQSWQSPDGSYTVTVWRHPRLYAMPGQGSDAPGTVTLTDRSGRVVQSVPIAMVQLASKPRWEGRKVSMKLIFEWDLD